MHVVFDFCLTRKLLYWGIPIPKIYTKGDITPYCKYLYLTNDIPRLCYYGPRSDRTYTNRSGTQNSQTSFFALLFSLSSWHQNALQSSFEESKTSVLHNKSLVKKYKKEIIFEVQEKCRFLSLAITVCTAALYLILITIFVLSWLKLLNYYLSVHLWFLNYILDCQK